MSDVVNSLAQIRERLYLIVPIGLSVLLFVVQIVLLTTRLMPLVEAHAQRVEELQLLEAQLQRLEAAQKEGPERLRRAISEARERLQKAGERLLSESEAAAVFDIFYQQAERHGVRITGVQALPRTKPAPGVPYEVRSFRVIVEGPVPQLLRFAASVSERHPPAAQITNINIMRDPLAPETSRLSMDVLLYLFAPVTEPAARSP